MDQGLNAERNSRLFLLFILYKLIVMERKRYCQLSGRCGGCSYVNIDYRDELLTKYILEEKFLKRFGKVSPIIPSDPYTGYRCKVQAVCRSEGNSLVTGIYRKGSHKLIPVKRCPLEDPRASEILSSIRTLSRRFGIQGYDEDLDSGLLRHVLIRIGARTGEVLVALVVSDENFSSSKDFAAALHQRHPNIKTVVAVRNREKTSMVIPEDAPEKILYGKGYIIDLDGRANCEGEWKKGIVEQSTLLINGWYKVEEDPLRLPIDCTEINVPAEKFKFEHYLDLSKYKQAKKIVIGAYNFCNTDHFSLSDSNHLEELEILDHSFYRIDPTNRMNRTFSLVDCARLRSIIIGSFSFQFFSGEFELSGLPSLELLKIGAIDDSSTNFNHCDFVVKGKRFVR